MARTEHALAELLAQDLSGLGLVALMVDGIRMAEHCCVVTLGVTIDHTKIPLALAARAAENERTPPSSVTCWPACASTNWR